MTEKQPKAEWVVRLPSGESSKRSLARVVDADSGRDEAENMYYEWAADPQFVQEERDQRRYRGAYLRRLRHWANRSRDEARRD